jgi:hypothetical protein
MTVIYSPLGNGWFWGSKESWIDNPQDQIRNDTRNRAGFEPMLGDDEPNFNWSPGEWMTWNISETDRV